MHLPDEHTLPVSHSLVALTLHVVLHTLRAAAVAVAVCMLQILLAHCEAEVHTALIAKLVFTMIPVEAVKVPVDDLTRGRAIAAPVAGILSLSPEDNVKGVFTVANAAAHVPILVAPKVTTFAQLLLAQSAFSLQTPPLA